LDVEAEGRHEKNQKLEVKNQNGKIIRKRQKFSTLNLK
jgi:hypothetical protein